MPEFAPQPSLKGSPEAANNNGNNGKKTEVQPMVGAMSSDWAGSSLRPESRAVVDPEEVEVIVDEEEIGPPPTLRSKDVQKFMELREAEEEGIVSSGIRQKVEPVSGSIEISAKGLVPTSKVEGQAPFTASVDEGAAESEEKAGSKREVA